jgi:hypothetical protein
MKFKRKNTRCHFMRTAKPKPPQTQHGQALLGAKSIGTGVVLQLGKTRPKKYSKNIVGFY